MRLRFAHRSAVALMLAVLTLVTAGCSDTDENSDDAPPATSAPSVTAGPTGVDPIVLDALGVESLAELNDSPTGETYTAVGPVQAGILQVGVDTSRADDPADYAQVVAQGLLLKLRSTMPEVQRVEVFADGRLLTSVDRDEF